MTKFTHSKTFISLLLAIFVLALIAFGREGYRNFEISREIKSLEKKIKELKLGNEELSKIEEFFHSREFLEKEARLKLNLIKPGEKVIIVKEQEPAEKPEQKEDIAKEISNIQRWWEYFFEKGL